MSKVRLAIIGNGMVGHRFIEDLLDKADAEQFDITVFCEEPRKAYDRVHLSSYFSHHTAEELSLVREGFYEKHGVKVLVGERAITINRQEKVIHSSAGRTVFYDKLIMATGSYPWIPPIKGSETQDCFVYRTIEDLNAIESCARRSRRGAVVGGGLELATSTHVRVAGRSTFYQLPEGQRGIFVGGGASVRVSKIIGPDRMTEMMLTGRRYDAEDGYRLGLSHYLVDDAEVLPEAMPAARLRMLPPDTAELVPMAPTTPSPLLPSTLCHWMPNSASLLAVTSTIRLSTSTCARRPSSLSITARSWRYWGSGAVMMSELVVGSAWICPPVEGWLLLALLEPPPAPMPRPPLPPSPALLLELLADAVLDDAAEVASPPEPEVPAAAAPLPPPVADMAARSVVASLVASAFLRYTTWMLPLAALLPGAGAWSSWATRARTWATRAGLAARRISELLRGSAISVVLNEAR